MSGNRRSWLDWALAVSVATVLAVLAIHFILTRDMQRQLIGGNVVGHFSDSLQRGYWDCLGDVAAVAAVLFGALRIRRARR